MVTGEDIFFDRDLLPDVDGVVSVGKQEGEAGRDFLASKEGLLTTTNCGRAAFLAMSLASQLEVKHFFIIKFLQLYIFQDNAAVALALTNFNRDLATFLTTY